ncbi:MAG: hypothetical protein GAK30_00108 [Paracidovorax wautersii]|uniref:Tripartite-type tricarboxylate transporter, receptor component TctC n=1 Tax=Paracidovorax wautersii TaxID=1177982 RepID=A0A7V8FSL6_9BURK|nr:MAG: hypothetical protein GAK30_00108 [Paracidovorax wautersii]
MTTLPIHPKRLRLLLPSAALAALLLGASPAQAQADWPNKPVTLVVNFPPGGSTDQVARAIAPRLAAKLGQPFVIDNKAGATGTIGAGFVKRAPADGYTFLVTSLGPLVIAPHLLKSVPYNAADDFDYLTVAVRSPNVLVVPVNSPFKTVADLVAHLKAHPGQMTFASAGTGTSDHLTAELFWQKTGTRGVHVPYKGGGPAHTDLMGSQADASFQNINAILQYVKGERMRALAITSRARSPLLPDVPTLDEAGVRGVDVTSWQAIVAPKGLPPEIKRQAYDALAQVLNDPAVSAPFTALGFEMVINSPTEFAAFQKAESARWKSIIDTAGITLD